MRRRAFITTMACSFVAWPLAAHAQQANRTARVAFWMGGSNPADPQGQALASAFRDTLRGLGWVDGRNLQVDIRWGATSEAVSAAATEIATLNPDVIVTTGAPVLAVLHRQTKNIPIVFTMITDPVTDGFVASLARPGGNITGFTIFEHSFAGKWLEMLKETVPSIRRLAVMGHTDHPAWNAYQQAISKVATPMGIEVTPTPVTSPGEIEPTLSKFAAVPNGGLVILPSTVGTAHRATIADAALRHRLPSIYSQRIYVESGGLMSYGVAQDEVYRQAAAYVDRILRGAKPAELPVQAAAKFEMAFNLKTAKTLGITVPATMLGRADEVIE